MTVEVTTHFVGGASLAPPGETEIDVLSPHRRRVVGRIPIGGDTAVAAAVGAAAAAFPAWRRVALAERIELLLALKDRIDTESLAQVLVDEVGKPIRSARIEADNVVASLDYFAQQAPRRIPPAPEDTADPGLRIVRDPRGVVLAITPCNFPVQLLAWKLAPAVLAGCTVVCKPDPRTPLTTAMLAEWSAAAGWPAGVFNVVYGDAATGAALVGDPRVAAIAFTGSVASGCAVYRGAAERVKKVTLELGGCSALVVCRNADLAGSMPHVVSRAFYNSGQYCFRINRAYVHRDRYREFLESFTGAARQLVVGDPHDEATDLGPLIDRGTLDRVLAQVAQAESAGGRVVLDGRALCADGSSVLGPIVLADVPADAEIMRSETFGPVVSVAPFDDLDQAIALANGTDYGLAAFALAGDPETSERLARDLDAGTVWVNALGRSSMDAPFGGVKLSGVGTEKSRWAFDEYLQPRAIYISGGSEPR